MHRFRPFSHGGIILGLMLLVLHSAGCGQDSPVEPAATGGLNASQAQQWSSIALDLVDDMAVNVDNWAAADFSGINTMGSAAKAPLADPTWDPTEQAWVLSASWPVTQMTPPDSMVATLDYWLQFRNDMGPVMLPDSATTYEVRLGTGLDAHQDDGTTVSDLHYLMSTVLTVSGLGTDTYHAVGNGSSTVTLDATSAEGSAQTSFEMSWALDLTVPAAGGCPAGTANVSMPSYHLDAVYDGLGGVSWTLTGPGTQASGSRTLSCGTP